MAGEEPRHMISARVLSHIMKTFIFEGFDKDYIGSLLTRVDTALKEHLDLFLYKFNTFLLALCCTKIGLSWEI